MLYLRVLKLKMEVCFEVLWILVNYQTSRLYPLDILYLRPAPATNFLHWTFMADLWDHTSLGGILETSGNPGKP